VDDAHRLWLNDEVRVPWRVAIALGVGDVSLRFHVISSLAKQLRLDAAKTSDEMDYFLASMLRPLDSVLEADGFVDGAQHDVAGGVTAGMNYALVELAAGFGWSDQFAVEQRTTFASVERTIEESFEKLLANRLFQLLKHWEKTDVFAKTKLGVVSAARPRSH
jgi:hypothetical protein